MNILSHEDILTAYAYEHHDKLLSCFKNHDIAGYQETLKEHLDGCGGAVVVSIGHGVEEVVEVMAKQARKVCYAFIGEFTSPWQEKLASQVISLSPKGLSKVYFVSSGSEATEAAMALARVYRDGDTSAEVNFL